MARHANPTVNGDEIRRLRIRSGVNLSRFAAKLGVSPQYMSAVERGGRPRVSPERFASICDALGVPEAERDSLIAVDVKAPTA